MPSSQNPFAQLLPSITSKPPLIAADDLKGGLNDEALLLLKRAGITATELSKAVARDIQVSWDRYNLYQEFERALEHWFVGPAIDLYANVATTYSPMHNATIWVTAESEKVQSELNNMLDRIGIEEKIHDWAYTVAGYGDLFVKPKGVPGLGLIAVDDSQHPMSTSRVDHEGVLVGFYQTPSGQSISGAPQYQPSPGGQGMQEMKLLPPWEYVHFRLLGAKKRRPKGPNEGYSTTRQVHLISGAQTRQVSTTYGTSIITNGLPAYKRLRLAEDSLLLARLTRGIIRYVWKMKVDMNNMEAAASLMDQYATIITRARAIDKTPGSEAYDSKQNPMSVIEDIFVPVWGDVGDLSHDKIGGDPDIRWIVDIDLLRNQLSFALATPAALGGAFVKEATGAIGSEAISKLDIRFARSARRLQRSLIVGIERLCQLHLAYMGMDPDPNLFQVHMSETSTAEEESQRKSLESGAKTFSVLLATLSKVMGKKLDKEKAWEYYNEKLLRLDDLRLEDFEKDPSILQKEAEAARAAQAAKEREPEAPGPGKEKPAGEESTVRLRPESVEEVRKKRQRRGIRERRAVGMDLYSYLPVRISINDTTKDSKLLESYKKKISVLEERGIKVQVLKEGSSWVSQLDALSWYDVAGECKIRETVEGGKEREGNTKVGV